MGEENKQNKPSICTNLILGKLNDKTTFNECQEFLRFIEMLKQVCGVHRGGMEWPEAGVLVEFRLDQWLGRLGRGIVDHNFPLL